MATNKRNPWVYVTWNGQESGAFSASERRKHDQEYPDDKRQWRQMTNAEVQSFKEYCSRLWYEQS